MTQSLFYEYAITPDVFDAGYISSDRRLEVILIQLLKGISDNGMIANLNYDKWLKHIETHHLQAILPFDLKDKIRHLLSLLHDRHRIVWHPKATSGDPLTNVDWLSLAIESHRNVKLDGIIASREVLDNCTTSCEEFIDALEVLDSPHWEGRKRTLTLQTSEPYYTPVLDPILRHARSLTIVDPYFSPHVKKFVDFLKICIEQMGRRGHHPVLKGRIIIHAGNPVNDRNNPESVSNRLDSWEKMLRKNFQKTILHKIKVILRDQNYPGQRFHDRFILTDQCCISIPMGTDTYSCKTTNSTTWSLLDHDDMQKKAAEIDPEMDIFAVLGHRQLT